MAIIERNRSKESVLKEKSKIPFHWWTNWHRAGLSSKRSRQRYWIFIFTKPAGYKHKEQEPVWQYCACIWDTKEEKMVNKIYLEEFPSVNEKLLGFEYNHEHKIMLVKRMHQVVVYSFESKDPLFTAGTNNMFDNGIPINDHFYWRMPNANEIIFNDTHSNWYHIILDREEPARTISHVHFTGPIHPSELRNAPGIHIVYISESDEGGGDPLNMPKQEIREVAVIIKVAQSGYHLDDHPRMHEIIVSRLQKDMRNSYERIMYINMIMPVINLKKIRVQKGRLIIPNVLSMVVDESIYDYWTDSETPRKNSEIYQ